MKRFLTPLLVVIFVLGFLVRLYRFDNPVADWHAFRQGDTNAVSQVFSNEGINFLYPRYFDISNVQAGMDNPKGFRFVEFPVYNAVQAGLFKFFGPPLRIEQWGRLVSIISTLIGAYLVYLLVKKYANAASGFFSAFFYLFLPFSIFYGRVILPDPSMAASIIAGIYFFDKWIESLKPKTKNKKNKQSFNTSTFMLAAGFTALALLLKPFAIFFTLPIIYLAFKQFKINTLKKWQLWLFAFLCLTPLVLWRLWISQFPEGVPASSWLLNGNGIRFHPAFFRWILYERITKLILGFSGLVFLIGGVYSIFKHKNSGFFLSFIVSSLLYVSVVATGNVQHDYYQILIIPTIAIILGPGVIKLFEIISKTGGKKIAAAVCSVLIVLSVASSWNMVRDYFNINDRGMVAAGKYANEILPEDAVVIAPYDNSTTFLNIIARRGWPVFQEGIDELIQEGAEYLVIANPTKNDFEGFGKRYQRVAESKDYLILKLVR